MTQEESQTRALLEIAKALVLIAGELAALREALPNRDVWHELCLSVRSDHPLLSESFSGIADGLENIATAMENHTDAVIATVETTPDA